jgi:hypothetical protein
MDDFIHFPVTRHQGIGNSGQPNSATFEKYPVLLAQSTRLAHQEKLAGAESRRPLSMVAKLQDIAPRDFQKPKIIYPNMTKYLPFYLDTTEHFFINDKAFILTSETESLAYLTAALNSTVFRCCFMDNFPNLGEDRRELRKIFMDKIPIKKPTTQQASPVRGAGSHGASRQGRITKVRQLRTEKRRVVSGGSD